MAQVIQPWQILLAALAGWGNRHEQAVIDYLREENRGVGRLRQEGGDVVGIGRAFHDGVKALEHRRGRRASPGLVWLQTTVFEYHIMMRMSVRLAVATAATLWALACTETITAPGDCPAFCPPERIDLVDSVFVGAVVRDSTFPDFVSAHGVELMQLVTAGSVAETRGVGRVFPFGTFVVGGQDSIVGVDSFRLDLTMRRRNIDVAALEVAVYRLPDTVDTSVVFSDLTPFFVDSNLVTTIPIHDTLTVGIVSGTFPATALPGVGADSTQATFGLQLRSVDATYLELGTAEAGTGVRLTRFVAVQGPDTVTVVEGLTITEFDTFLADAAAPAADSILVVGGVPAARSILRIELPPEIIDSADIVRATLLLVPVDPVLGAPDDTSAMLAYAVARDVGQKSPPRPTNPVVVGSGATLLVTGSTDTLRLDVTDIFRTWATDSRLPHTIGLLAAPEAGRVIEIRLGSSRGSSAPRLHLTYIPAFTERRK